MPAGRPRKYETPEELENKIDEYFESGCTVKEVIITNQKSKTVKTPTISGLAIYLGFESRQALYDIEKNKEFSYTIKRARTRMEMHYEELLQSGVTTGAIFALKNFGWTDKQVVEHQGNEDKPLKFEGVRIITDTKTS